MKQFFLALNTCEKTLLFIVLVIYGHNLFIDIMIVDAAQYASIALEMYATNSYLAIFDLGVDYLDKPPLLFWISSLFFKAFGVHTLTYKLGSFFMLLLAVYSTYKFTLLYYTQSIAKNAALLLATCQAFFLMTNDVRTDGLLLSSVITAIWLLSNYLITKKINYLVRSSCCNRKRPIPRRRRRGCTQMFSTSCVGMCLCLCSHIDMYMYLH
jgi:4-amino-4-deoxy-L-arabinose transferase-like glycosyltransferase